ncbi:MAG: DUF4395 domain-containing protein [Micrococcales bacterium]
MSKQIVQIDPRGPRFGASIINVFSIIIFFLALDAATVALAQSVLAIVWVSFLWGTLFGNTKHPFGLLYKKLVRPRLAAPKELEDARPPRFAQFVGLFVTSIGFVLSALAVPFGIAIAAGALFAASTLQAYFGYCLGCQIYLSLRRVGVIRG